MNNMDNNQSNIDWEVLYNEALKYRDHSYSPYSNYKVGAALLTKSGQIYGGCNIENASYTPCICAERTAIFKAISEGDNDFLAIAVVTENGGTPCGVCRQVIREFAPNLLILVSDINYQHKIFSLADLLPHSFGPEQLTP